MNPKRNSKARMRVVVAILVFGPQVMLDSFRRNIGMDHVTPARFMTFSAIKLVTREHLHVPLLSR